ncbi:MAG: VCBS repeat-containing protein, partial [Acidobacteriales bacterium]|nr:VCBS repeat-containing protein [Terriglobales bacterium]
PTTDGVTTLRGLGNGTFASKIDYAAGLDPVAISAADYTGDGRTDLAVANDVDNTVSIIANTGGGLFNVRQGVTVGNMPNGIAVSDYNGDGVLDMAVADRGDNQVLLLRGNGDGTFTNANNPVTVGAKPSSIITVDLNKDGILDLVTTNASDNTVSVALGTGSGTFGAARSAKVGSRPVAVIARDFNTDGNMDLAVANQNTLTVSVLLGNGDGTFKAAKSYTTGPGTNPSWLDAGALSGTRLSIVVANNGTGTISVLLGNGDGTFTLPVQYTAGSGPSGIVLADLNGDGNLDAAVSNQTSNTVSVLTGNGNGTFNTHVDYAVPSNPFFVTTADLSGDGKVDLVVGSSNVNQNRVSILKGNGDGTFQIHQDHATKLNAGGPSEALGIGDFNGDGALDVAAADQVANTVDVLLNDATLAFSPQTINFGTLAIGQPSSPQPVTATNAGSAVISNLNVTSTGDFSETDTCPATLAIGASCTSQVTFTATQSGLRTGSLSFTDNAPSSPQNVALQGTGGGPGATLSQTQLTFPNTLIGMTSVKQVVNLTNTGSSNLTITSIASNSSQFSQTNTCPTTLLVNATCTITVTFKPTQTGQLTGAIVVTDNAFNSPQSVNLTGVGTEVKLNPIKLFFGNQAVGTSSTPQTVTLSNVGTVTLNVSSIAISGLNPNDYSQTNNCPTGLVGGASCTITVTFKPTAKGDRPATLAVTDDGGGSPQTVPLDGTGI